MSCARLSKSCTRDTNSCARHKIFHLQCPFRGSVYLKLVASCYHTLEKSRSQEERPAQPIFRQRQTDASRRRQSSALSTASAERKGRGDERRLQGGLS